MALNTASTRNNSFWVSWALWVLACSVSMAVIWILMAHTGWPNLLGVTHDNPTWDTNLFALWPYENAAHTLVTFAFPPSFQSCGTRQRKGIVWGTLCGVEEGSLKVAYMDEEFTVSLPLGFFMAVLYFPLPFIGLGTSSLASPQRTVRDFLAALAYDRVVPGQRCHVCSFPPSLSLSHTHTDTDATVTWREEIRQESVLKKARCHIPWTAS